MGRRSEFVVSLLPGTGSAGAYSREVPSRVYLRGVAHLHVQARVSCGAARFARLHFGGPRLWPAVFQGPAPGHGLWQGRPQRQKLQTVERKGERDVEAKQRGARGLPSAQLPDSFRRTHEERWLGAAVEAQALRACGLAQLRGAMLRHVAQGDSGVERPRHRRRGPNLDVARVLRVEVRRPARTRLWHARLEKQVPRGVPFWSRVKTTAQRQRSRW